MTKRPLLPSECPLCICKASFQTHTRELEVLLLLGAATTSARGLSVCNPVTPSWSHHPILRAGGDVVPLPSEQVL